MRDGLASKLGRHVSIAHRKLNRLNGILAKAPAQTTNPVVHQITLAVGIEEVLPRPEFNLVVTLATRKIRVAY